jgi:hypothetical protein
MSSETVRTDALQTILMDRQSIKTAVLSTTRCSIDDLVCCMRCERRGGQVPVVFEEGLLHKGRGVGLERARRMSWQRIA